MEEVINCFLEMLSSCAGYALCSIIVQLFNFLPLSFRKGAGARMVTFYYRETGLVQTLAGAGAVTTIPTAEGDGLVMGLLDRRAKFCVLVRRTTWALSFDPGAVKEQNLQQYGVLSSLKPKAFQTGKAQ